MLSRGDSLLTAGIALVGLVVGYMVAASGTPVVSTVLPLVFGLVTISFPLLTIWKSDGESAHNSERIETAKRLAGISAIFFVIFFSVGILGGQWHKRFYARVDLANLTGEEVPQLYTTAEKWFMTSAHLKSVGASEEVKGVFYSLLLKQEAEIIKQQKSTNTVSNKMQGPEKEMHMATGGSSGNTPIAVEWPDFSRQEGIAPLEIPLQELLQRVSPKLDQLEKMQLKQVFDSIEK